MKRFNGSLLGALILAAMATACGGGSGGGGTGAGGEPQPGVSTPMMPAGAKIECPFERMNLEVSNAQLIPNFSFKDSKPGQYRFVSVEYFAQNIDNGKSVGAEYSSRETTINATGMIEAPLIVGTPRVNCSNLEAGETMDAMARLPLVVDAERGYFEGRILFATGTVANRAGRGSVALKGSEQGFADTSVDLKITSLPEGAELPATAKVETRVYQISQTKVNVRIEMKDSASRIRTLISAVYERD